MYPCACTRAQLRHLPRGSAGETVYPGTCRSGARPAGLPPALRFRLDPPSGTVCVDDALQGRCCQDVSTEIGDFVIHRRDGFFAYQLAVVVDDAAQGITRVVRGCDLLDHTPRQRLLQRALGLAAPTYAHLPLVVEPDGTKLAKSRRSVPLDARVAPALLLTTLELLRQQPPAELAAADCSEILRWARAHWRPEVLAGRRILAAPEPTPAWVAAPEALR